MDLWLYAGCVPGGRRRTSMTIISTRSTISRPNRNLKASARVEALFLTTDETRLVLMSAKVIDNRLEKYDEAIAGIQEGHFPPKPNDRTCPQVPSVLHLSCRSHRSPRRLTLGFPVFRLRTSTLLVWSDARSGWTGRHAPNTSERRTMMKTIEVLLQGECIPDIQLVEVGAPANRSKTFLS